MTDLHKLRCNNCGAFVDPEHDKPHVGKEFAHRCSRTLNKHNGTWSCGGRMYWWAETYNLYDKVVHPETGKEVFTIVGVTPDKIKLRGDWSGIGLSESEEWMYKEGWVIHSRVHWIPVLEDTPEE